MTERIGPIGPVTAKTDEERSRDRRARDRRTTERREDKAAEASTSRDLVPVGIVIDHEAGPATPAPRPEATGTAAAFAAQILGQGGQRNGIRGGPPVMDAARATYLEAEYSGDKDRRPPTGKAKRTEV